MKSCNSTKPAAGEGSAATDELGANTTSPHTSRGGKSCCDPRRVFFYPCYFFLSFLSAFGCRVNQFGHFFPPVVCVEPQRLLIADLNVLCFTVMCSPWPPVVHLRQSCLPCGKTASSPSTEPPGFCFFLSYFHSVSRASESTSSAVLFGHHAQRQHGHCAPPFALAPYLPIFHAPNKNQQKTPFLLSQVEEVVDDRRGDARTGVTITPVDSPRRW